MNLLTLNHDPLFLSETAYLDFKDFSTLSQVCREWRRFAQGNPLWKKIAEKIHCPGHPNDDNQSLPEKYFFKKVQTHVLDLISKIQSLRIIQAPQRNSFADADRSILPLVLGPPTMRKVKQLQKYLTARDQILLWRMLPPNIQTLSEIPLNYVQMVQCAKRLSPLLSQKSEATFILNFLSFSGFSIPKNLFKFKKLEILQFERFSERGQSLHVMTIPPEIGCFTQLQRLMLKGHRIPSLPSAIGSLVELDYLNISENELTVLPQEIGNLRNLRSLNASRNKLRSLPQEIGNLTQLIELDLSTNQIDSLPKEIGELKKLRKLFLSNNLLHSLPPEFQQLQSLETLFLNFNDFEEAPKMHEKIGEIHEYGNPYYKRKIQRINRFLQLTCAGLFCLFIQIKYRNIN